MKTGVPDRLQHPVTFISIASRPDLANEHGIAARSIGPLHPHVVLDHATSTRLVAGDSNRIQPDFALLSSQTRQAAFELRLDFSGVERQCNRRQLAIRGSAKWIRYAHREASSANNSDQSASKRSTCPLTEKWSSARRRDALPIRA